jgi:hypothetical protein
LIEKPAFPLVEKPDGAARPAGPATADSHRVRIREAAYGLYEARGRADGHDVEDWLAAEATLAADRPQT